MLHLHSRNKDGRSRGTGLVHEFSRFVSFMMLIVLLGAISAPSLAFAPDTEQDNSVPDTSATLPLNFAWDQWTTGAIPLDSLDIHVKHVPRGFLPELEMKRPRVALALSGGGARGLAHIGVIQGFEEHNLPIDCVVGTSMGGVVAGLYGAGYNGNRLAGVARGLDWGSLFSDAPSRRNLFLAQKETAKQDLVTMRFRHDGEPYIPDALVTGETLFIETFRLIHEAPYAPLGSGFNNGYACIGLVTTDIVSGHRVFLRDGDLSLAMRAAMAVPIIFRPLRQDGQLLVDGGAVENIPVRAALEEADIVIAVDCATATSDPDPDMPWEILNQVTTLMTVPNDSVSRSLADYVITPVMEGIGNTDFDMHSSIVEAGREAFDACVEDLKAVLPDAGPDPDILVTINHVRVDRDFNGKLPIPLPQLDLKPGIYSTRELNQQLTRYLRQLRERGYGMAQLQASIAETELVVDLQIGVLGKVAAEGIDDYRARFQLREIGLKPGQVLLTSDIVEALQDVHATQLYTTVYCRIDRLPNNTLGLTFLLEPAPPVRLGLGLGYGSDWGARYKSTLVIEQALPFIGEELRFHAMFGEHRQDYSIQLRADRIAGSYAGWQGGVRYDRIDAPLYDADGERTDYAIVAKSSASATALFNLYTWGRLSAGIKGERAEDELDGFERDNYYSAFELAAEIDTEDRRPYPTSGVRIDASYDSYFSEIGGSRAFSVFDLDSRLTLPVTDRLFLRTGFRSGVAELTTPSTHRFYIGGLDTFPALQPYRYRALRHLGTNITLRYDLISRLIADAYVMLRYDGVAYGNDKDWKPERKDILNSFSIGFALDTRLGPLEIWSAWTPPAVSHRYHHRVAVNFGYRF